MAPVPHHPPHRRTAARTAATPTRSRILGNLVHNAVLEVRDPRRLDRPEFLELQIRSYSVEEARASAQEDRRDVQLQLVDQTGRQVLVDDVGAAADEDVLLAGGLPRLLQGRLDSIGDKVKVVSERISGSRSWCVRTKTGLRKGGSSPHHPRHGSSPHGPRVAGPNLPRPMISAPTFAFSSATTALLTFSSPPSMPTRSRHAFRLVTQS